MKIPSAEVYDNMYLLRSYIGKKEQLHSDCIFQHNEGQTLIRIYKSDTMLFTLISYFDVSFHVSI